MSFNFAVSAASSATLHSLSSVAALEPAAAGGHGGGSMTAMSVDDIPLCLTPPRPPIPHQIGSQLDRVALNPQPLPPKEGFGGKATFDGDWCGTVPHKLPPFPPPPGPWGDLANAAGNIAR